MDQQALLLPSIVPRRFGDCHRMRLFATLRFKHLQDNDHMISEMIQNPTNAAFYVGGCTLQDGSGCFPRYEGLPIHLAAADSSRGEEPLSYISLCRCEYMDGRQTAL